MKKAYKRSGIRPDVAVVCLVTALVTLGLVFVYSASMYSAQKDFGNKYYFLNKQIVGALVGAAAMTGAAFFPAEKLKKAAVPLFIASVVLLGLVFVPGLGIENYGAKRWIGVGGFSFQPSEIAKFAFVILASAYMAKRPADMKKFRGILAVAAMGVTVCLLVIAEPNMSITMCVALVMVAIMFIGGAKIRHLAMCLLPLAVAVPLLIAVEPYRMARLMAYLDPWASPLEEGYQLLQSFYGLGSGGLLGVGLFNSRQKYLFLPFAESDFIFSVIGEEFGYIGCLIVIAAFCFMIYRLAVIAQNAADRFGFFLSSGMAALIGVQVLINIAVVTGSIPPTGIPLPFISAGSSSLIVFCAGIGMCQSVSLRSHASVRALL